jgi:hypothetical protein
VTCNHVVEHVYDAYHLVKLMHRIIKPGGRLWLETPNINSAGHALFGKAWRGIESPRHIAILSFEALNSILTAAGVAITHRTRWNIQHIRGMFSASEAIRTARDPIAIPTVPNLEAPQVQQEPLRATRTPLLPNWKLVKGLCLEALFVHRREFVCLRAIKRADRPL